MNSIFRKTLITSALAAMFSILAIAADELNGIEATNLSFHFTTGFNLRAKFHDGFGSDGDSRGGAYHKPDGMLG